MENSKSIHSSNDQADRITNLPKEVLLLIFSLLSFRDNIRISKVSKSWRNLCYDTKNISFKECNYVDNNVVSSRAKRASFVQYMHRWVDKLTSPIFNSFEICFSDQPLFFKEDVEFLISFAASRNVKNLLLDFSDQWDFYWPKDFVVELPESVYSLQTLEALKIHACKFDPSKFETLALLTKLSIGWFEFNNMDTLLSKFPSLESLRLKSCIMYDELVLNGKFRKLFIEHCDFNNACRIDSPNLEIFEYTGKLVNFQFMDDVKNVKEVYLDFSVEEVIDDSLYSDITTGLLLTKLLNKLRFAKNLTVCSFLLKMIQESDIPDDMLGDLETTDLVLYTNLNLHEFMGIRILLRSCPNLETLTFYNLSPSPFQVDSHYDNNEDLLWLLNTSYRCLRRTLKTLVVKYFYGSWNEFYMVWYLAQPQHGDALKKIELHMPNSLEGDQKNWVHDVVKKLKDDTSGRVQVILLEH